MPAHGRRHETQPGERWLVWCLQERNRAMEAVSRAELMVRRSPSMDVILEARKDRLADVSEACEAISDELRGVAGYGGKLAIAHYLEGRTWGELAKQAGTSTGTVRRLVARAIKTASDSKRF